MIALRGLFSLRRRAGPPGPDAWGPGLIDGSFLLGVIVRRGWLVASSGDCAVLYSILAVLFFDNIHCFAMEYVHFCHGCHHLTAENISWAVGAVCGMISTTVYTLWVIGALASKMVVSTTSDTQVTIFIAPFPEMSECLASGTSCWLRHIGFDNFMVPFGEF